MSSVLAGVIPFVDPGAPGGPPGFRLIAVAYSTKTRRDALPWACPTEGLSGRLHDAVVAWASVRTNAKCVFRSFSGDLSPLARFARTDSSTPAIFRATLWDLERFPTIAQVRVTAVSLLHAEPLCLSASDAKLLGIRLHGPRRLLQEAVKAVGTCDRFARLLGRYAGCLDTCKRPPADSPCVMADTYSQDSSIFLQVRVHLALIRAIRCDGSVRGGWSVAVDWQQDASRLAACSQPLFLQCRDWLRSSASLA
mmetsp:Transcript_47831/g.110034  ORF Transcript_47831/g.110034 Transcript_47831/m.110034 type:complete len:252 (-) Transcript_47831:296-1051(-)